MFATKILVASALAAGSLAFAAKPADAATHVSIGIGIPAPVVYYAPAPVVTYYTPVPTYYAPAPVYCAPVVAAPVCSAPPVVYQPDFLLRFGFGHDWHRDGWHRHY